MEKRMNERLNNAVIEEFMDLMDFGHSKMESYKIIAEHWDLSQKTVQRIVTKTLSNNTKTLNNNTASGQCFTSAQIVENICSKAKCKDYTKAFEKLNAGTTLWF